MDKVLLAVAPVSASKPETDPQKIARDVLACSKAGAGMVHLHARGRDGRLTADTSLLSETLRFIRRDSDILIEASTGGVSNLTIQERCAPLTLPEVEFASLNVGSVNLGESVYLNPAADVEFCMEQILRAGKIPDIEVFEIGMIHAALLLCKKFSLCAPPLFSIVLGHAGAAPATVQALTALRGFIPEGMPWGITHYGRGDSGVIAAAVSMGANVVRIGFEDSAALDSGYAADENSQIVAHFVRLLHSMGKRPMTAPEARALFGVG